MRERAIFDAWQRDTAWGQLFASYGVAVERTAEPAHVT
jgi:hypothetical protein